MYKLPVKVELIGEAEYARAVAAAVRRFERKVAPRRLRTGSKSERILKALKRLGRGTYRDVLREAGFPDTRNWRFCVCGYMKHLCAYGHARRCGTKTAAAPGVDPALYEFVSFERPKLPRMVENARNGLERTMDRLDELRRFVPCVAAAVCGAKNKRQAMMVRRRAKGLTLTAIGQEFGVTRERVRQIVAVTINRSRRTQSL